MREVSSEKGFVMGVLERQRHSVSVQDKYGWTALHWAIAIGKQDGESVGLLIRASSNLSIQSNSGQTPLHVVARHRRGSTLKSLLISGADVSIQDESSWTPLHTAVVSCRITVGDGFNDMSVEGWDNVVSMLLDAHANPNAQDVHSRTPLHLAALLLRSKEADIPWVGKTHWWSRLLRGKSALSEF